jgi:hypothetical protein
MAMQRIRYFLGFLLVFLFIIVVTCFVGRKVVEIQMRNTAYAMGFSETTMGTVDFSITHFTIKHLKLSHPEWNVHVLVDRLKIDFGWGTLLNKIFEKISARGVQVYGSITDINRLLVNHGFFDQHEQLFNAFFSDGFIFINEEKSYLIVPFEVEMEQWSPHAFKILSQSICFSPTLRSQQTIEGQFEPKKFGIETILDSISYNFGIVSINLEDLKLTFKDFIDQESFHKKTTIDLSLNQGHVSTSPKSTAENGAITFYLSNEFSQKEDELFVKGDGKIVYGKQPLTFETNYANDKLIFRINGQNLDITPLAHYLNDVSGEKFKKLQGKFNLKSSLEIPISRSIVVKNDSLPLALIQEIAMHATEGTIKNELSLGLLNTRWVHEAYSIEDLSGQLHFYLCPFQAVGDQELKAGSLSMSNITLSDLSLKFRYDNFFKFTNVDAKGLGGKFNLHSFHYKNPDNFTFACDAKDISLGEIVNFLDIKEIEGMGKISGQGTLSYSDESGLDLTLAHFSSSGKEGNLKYKLETEAPDSNITQQLDNKEESALTDNMAFKILEDLHFTVLNVDVEPINGEIQARVEILGFNPQVLNGYPFHFRINTTGQFNELVKGTLTHIRLPSDWKKFNKSLKNYRDKTYEK